MVDHYPLVSIRIPSFNHSLYIEDCLNSILLDNYPNKEIIILDDYSTDDTFEKAKRWARKHKDEISISVYQQAKNVGLTRNLNKLVDLCNGEYLVSLASDDILQINGIQSRVDYLEKNTNKMAVIGDCRVINAHNELIFRSAIEDLFKSSVKKYRTDEGIKRQVVGNWAIAGPSLMVRRSIYNKIGKYNTNHLIEDWDFYLRMVKKNLLGFIPNIVSSYRIHDTNISRNFKADVYEDQIRIARNHFKDFSLFYQWLLLKRIVKCTILKSLSK